jgi:Outer membrane protein beta-barrel domain
MYRFAKMVSLVAALCLVATAAQARSNKGSKEIAVSGSIQQSKEQGSSTTDNSLDASFSFGYFITDAIQVGYALFLSSATTTDDSTGATVSQTAFQFHDVFVDYYLFTNQEETLALYFGPSLGLALLDLTSDTGQGAVTASGSGVTFALHAGLKYFLSENTSVFGNLEQRTSDISVSASGGGASASASSTFNATSLLFGMSYVFGGGS